jgi:mannose-6-phosphate isomerase-like protein (cupin superfamily)
MKILRNEQTINRNNSDGCVVTEYDVGDKEIDFAMVTITGRYPHEKRVINQECKEIVYIHEGKGRVEVDGKGYALSPGDVVLIEAGEKFYWEGHMTLFISCRPAFTVDQHQAVD